MTSSSIIFLSLVIVGECFAPLLCLNMSFTRFFPRFVYFRFSIAFSSMLTPGDRLWRTLSFPDFSWPSFIFRNIHTVGFQYLLSRSAVPIFACSPNPQCLFELTLQVFIAHSSSSLKFSLLIRTHPPNFHWLSVPILRCLPAFLFCTFSVPGSLSSDHHTSLRKVRPKARFTTFCDKRSGTQYGRSRPSCNRDPLSRSNDPSAEHCYQSDSSHEIPFAVRWSAHLILSGILEKKFSTNVATLQRDRSEFQYRNCEFVNILPILNILRSCYPNTEKLTRTTLRERS